MALPTRSRNPRGEGARLREEILDAAAAIVDESRTATPLTLRGIARRAGISAPSIYPHFPDLATVTKALLARSFAELYAAVEDAGAASSNPIDGLLAAGGAYVNFAWQHTARYRLMFSAGGYAPDAVKTFTVVEEHIRTCVAAGISDSTDPHLDTWMLWAGLHGVATLEKPARDDYLRLGTLDRPAMLKTIITRLARIQDPRQTSTKP